MNEDTIAVLIPIVAIVFGVSAGMLGSWFSHRRKQQGLEQVHKERMVALEKGLPMPDVPAGLLGSNDGPTAASALRNGIMLTLIGVLLYFALARVADENVAIFGLIPAAVGVANLLYAWMLARRERRDAPGVAGSNTKVGG
ncbi:MAG TPA: DUF6249 domain-containing protein [Steroidobacteraceae bacterium]|nr:DUF6249 domain-containing protein [Steroidobacteraceae bacterium]HRX90294.1 DUF6249 domain-containing protein [Steroidobacteraceae bacterium]